MTALTHPSPHHNGRGRSVPRVLVLHATAGKSDKGDLAWLADPVSKVSYHALIGRQGQLYTCVPLERRAWHAGVSAWNGVKDVNAVSIGLAFCNAHDGVEALTPIQISVALGVVEGWARSVMTLEAVTTHRAIAPDRKSDPHKAPGFELADFEAAFARGVFARKAAA